MQEITAKYGNARWVYKYSFKNAIVLFYPSRCALAGEQKRGTWAQNKNITEGRLQYVSILWPGCNLKNIPFADKSRESLNVNKSQAWTLRKGNLQIDTTMQNGYMNTFVYTMLYILFAI